MNYTTKHFYELLDAPIVNDITRKTLALCQLEPSMTSAQCVAVGAKLLIITLSLYLLDVEQHAKTAEERNLLRSDIFKAIAQSMDTLESIDIRATFEKLKAETIFDQMLARLPLDATKN